MVSWIFGGSVALAVIGAAAVVGQFVLLVAEADLFEEFADGDI